MSFTGPLSEGSSEPLSVLEPSLLSLSPGVVREGGCYLSTFCIKGTLEFQGNEEKLSQKGFSFMRSASQLEIKGTRNPPSPRIPVGEPEKGSPRYPGKYQSFPTKDPMSSHPSFPPSQQAHPLGIPDPRTKAPRLDTMLSTSGLPREGGAHGSGDGGGAGSGLTPGEEAREGPVFQRE